MVDKDIRGHLYLLERGEILRPSKDKQVRKHLPSVCLLSRTKVGGSKTIRYRRSPNYKLCRLRIGGRNLTTPSALQEKSKSLGPGGSMVARLKLKGIDGRAPPGVEPAA